MIWATIVPLAYAATRLSEIDTVEFWFSLELAQAVLLAAIPLLLLGMFDGFERRVGVLSESSARLETSVARFLEPSSSVGGNVVSIRHAVSSELAALNDQLNLSLERSQEIEERIRQEIGLVDRTFAENERRLRALVQELSRQRDTVVTATDQVRESVRKTNDDLNAELVQLSSRVIEAGNYARGLMEEVRGDIETVLTSVVQNIGDKVRDVISKRVDPVVEQMDRGLEKFGGLLSSGAGSINDAMDAQRRALSNELSRALDRLGTELDAKSNSALEHLRSAEDVVGQSLDSAVNRLETKIKASTLEFLQILDTGGESASAKVAESWERASEVLTGRLGTFNTSLDARMGELRTVVDKAQDRLIPAVEQASSRMSHAVELVGALDRSAGKLQQTLSVNAGEFADDLGRKLEGFQQQLVHASHELDARMSERLEESMESVDGHASQMLAALQSVRDTLSLSVDKITIAASEHGMVASRVSTEFSGLLDEAGRELSQRLRAELANLDAVMSKGLGDYTGLLNDRSAQLAAALELASRTESEQFDQGLANLNVAAGAAAAQLRQSFAALMSELRVALELDRKELEASSKATAGMIADGAQAVASDLARAAQAVIAGVAEQLDAARREFTTAAQQASAPLDQAVQDLIVDYATRTASLHSAMEARARSLDEMVSEASSRIEDQSGRLLRNVGQKISGLERLLAEGNDQIAGQLEQHLDRFKSTTQVADNKREQNFERELQSLATVLQGRADAFDGVLRTARQDLSERLNSATQQLETSLVATSARLSQEMAASGSDMLARTAAQIDGVTQALRGSTHDLEASLGAEAVSLRGELSSFLDTVSGVLESEKSGLLAAFDGRITVLEKLIATGTEAVSRAAQSEGDQLVRRLDGGAQTLKSVLATEAERFAGGLTGHLQQLREAISEASSAVASAVRQANRDLEGNVSRSTETTTEALAQLSTKLIKQMTISVDQVQHSLATGSETVMNRLATQEKTAIRRLEQASQSVEESTRRAAEVAVDRLVALNGMVAQAVGSVNTRRPKSSGGGFDGES